MIKKLKLPNWLIWSFTTFAVIGFIDSLYISIKTLQSSALNCSILDGCDVVINSVYSVFLGIPLSFWGLGYYLLIFFLALTYISTNKEFFIKSSVTLTFIGFIVSLFLVYLQVFIIEALCLYCIISAILSTLLFVFGVLIMVYLKKGYNK